MRKLDREIDDLVFGPTFRTAPAGDRRRARDAQSGIEDLIAMREIENDVCLAGRGKTVTMQSRACGGSEFGENVVVIETNGVETGRGVFEPVLKTRRVAFIGRA